WTEWEFVPVGTYFHIRNIGTGHYIRPENDEDFSAIYAVPNTWTGLNTQWRIEEISDGAYRFINRATGKYMSPDSSDDHTAVTQKPSTFNGAWTSWRPVAIAPLASTRFEALEKHILNEDSMSVAELRAWATSFTREAGALYTRPSDFAAAANLIRLYEETMGPLFTSAGQLEFAASWDGEFNQNRALARAVFRVYQAIMDSTNSTIIATHPELVDGLMFRSTENFPGTVPSITDLAETYDVRINASLPEEFGSDGGYDINPARRMTGAYLVPGTIAEITVPQALVNQGYVVRVGGHTWDLSNKPNVNRLYRVSRAFDITSTVTQVANPMGGNIYIDVPISADEGIVNVEFRNTIRAPFFSARSFDQTSQNEWENVERLHPGAYTDIESEYSMWTVPTKWVTNLSYRNLVRIVEAHDANIQVASEYVGKNARRHKAILYMIVDTQIRGRAFSIGYPQSNYGAASANTIRAPLSLDNAINKVLWHEHGHAEMVTMFAGEQEAHVHTLVTAILMENYGYTADEAFARSMAFGPDAGNFDTSDILLSWVLTSKFVNGQNMANAEAAYQPRGHGDYVEYIEMFGLEAMQQFNRQINVEMDGRDWDSWTEGRTNHRNSDRILRLSQAAGANVAPLFHLWGHAPNNVAELNSEAEAEGLGASALIYDRLVEAQNNVPLSQAEWNAVRGRFLGYVSPTQRTSWDAWNTGYDVARGEAAVARIGELITLYFPNGRP
ncbi:RICIN domain-containing protein, partial [Granulosicoccus sp.]|nr:RICIN domain-containing protein [Granulosicoccus sp.]